LAAAVDAEIERIPNALVVPRDSLLAEGGKMYIRVQKNGGWEKRVVKVIGQSDTLAAIEAGADAGDVVLTSTSTGVAGGAS
jgi:hypothetical protein